MKVDFKKQMVSYQARHGQSQELEIPPLQYLMIDGHGDPNTSPLYARALTTLYPVAYKIKFFSKRELDRDYVVPPLQALWWAPDLAAFTRHRDKNQWQWTVMLMVPEWITRAHFEQVMEAVRQGSGGDKNLILEELRLESLHEGTVVQTLHVGPYEDEGPVIAQLHEQAVRAGERQLTGKHHEIYLSDPRRTAPEKLRTILRQPFREGSA